MTYRPKYYNPMPEEFHLGFEFEFNKKEADITSKNVNAKLSGKEAITYKDNWIKKTANADFLKVINTITWANIRVKKLDKEDVLSIKGFREHHLNPRVLIRGDKKDFMRVIVYNQDQTSIEIYKKGKLVTMVSSFRIKNKSEFLRIIEQLW